MQYTIEKCEKVLTLSEGLFKSHELSGTTLLNYVYWIGTSYLDFVNNYRGTGIDTRNFRGLSICKNTGLSYLMLPKFFNFGENETTSYEELSKKKVLKVMNKFDGSLIRFVYDKDGNIISKTKKSTDSEHCKRVNEILNDNPKFKELIRNSLIERKAFLFEYISPLNKIVVDYREERLVLLAIRDEETGNFESLDKIDFSNLGSKLFIVAENLEILTLDQLIEKQKTMTGIEGYVVYYEDGTIAKFKTEEYKNLHRLFTNEVNKENVIVELILTEKIDDALNTLKEKNVDIHDYVVNLSKLLAEFYNNLWVSANKEFNNNLKTPKTEFSKLIKSLNDKFKIPFISGYIINCIKNNENLSEEVFEIGVKENIIKLTRDLEKAKTFLNKVVKVETLSEFIKSKNMNYFC